MFPELYYALLATVIISLIAVAVIIFIPQRWIHRREVHFLGFAAGILVATALLQLLPEAVEHDGSSLSAFYAALVGFIAFFYLDHVLHRGQSHAHEKDHVHSMSYLVVLGDGFHNLVDGMAIAIAFLADPALGVTATIAIAAHEIPQEIADYVVLTKSGLSKTKAILLNFASGLAAVAGAIIVFALGETVTEYKGVLLGITAGMFLYIAASEIIPDIHHAHHKRGSRLAIPFIAGVILIASIVNYAPEHHADEVHEEEHHATLITNP